MTDYKVDLDVYNGPLDLLLYLIRRTEVDIYDIPISGITRQYLEYVELLRELDPEPVSEFLVLAATLMEIKSRTLLPNPAPEETDDEIPDPRLELVRQLLEYKKFKDAARFLDDQAETQAMKAGRSPVRPPAVTDEVELADLDIWDLFTAFNRLLEQTGLRSAVHRVGVGIDDTPIALHAEDIIDSLERAGGSQRFEEIFGGRGKPEMIGLFLALLELIRSRLVRAVQDQAFETIFLHLIEATADDGIERPSMPGGQLMEESSDEREELGASDEESAAEESADFEAEQREDQGITEDALHAEDVEPINEAQ